MSERKNEPPLKFPLGTYKNFPTIVPQEKYVIGIDTGCSNLAISILKITNFNPQKRFFQIEEIIYPQDEILALPTQDDRIIYICNLFWDLVIKYKNIVAIALEKLPIVTAPKGKLNGLLLTHTITSCIQLIAISHNITFYELPVSHIKLVMAGSGNSSKVEVQLAVCEMIKHPYYQSLIMQNNHIADSLAIAIVCLKQHYNK